MSDFIVLDIETSGNSPWLGELQAVGLGGTVYKPGEGMQALRRALQTDTTIVCHTTYDLRWMLLAGATMGPAIRFHDTKVMAWLLDATQELKLDSVVERYLGYTPDKRITTRANRIVFRLDSGTYVPIEEAPWEQMKAYNQSDIDCTAELYENLRTQLQDWDLWEMFVAEEEPFSRLLVEIETTGMPFDREACIHKRDAAAVKADTIRREIVESVGLEDFNPGSDNQVSDYLYGEHFTLKSRIPIPKMSQVPKEHRLPLVQAMAPEAFVVEKVGRDYAHGVYAIPGRALKAPKIERHRKADARPSVSKPALLPHLEDEWVERYLNWKGVSTLLGFLNAWPEMEHDGRLFGRLNQAGTVTGRLSGSEPNLQQIPGHDEFGIREIFAGDLVVGDYAGLEVRLSAHFSQDPVMLDVFRSGKDLYGTLAANAWAATKENPRRALMKIVALGSQYGAQGDKLAVVIALAGMKGYNGKKADALLKDLEENLPRLFEWREEVIEESRGAGYVTTLAGRKRHLPDLNSAEWKRMALAERQAVNSKVQGSAADIVRRAMLACREAIDPERARMILQVHDEILWERGRGWRVDLLDDMRAICEAGTGFELSVPLELRASGGTDVGREGRRSSLGAPST